MRHSLRGRHGVAVLDLHAHHFSEPPCAFRSNEDRAGDEPVKGKRDVMQALSFFLAPHAHAASGAEPADDLEDAAVPSQPFSQDTTTVEAAGSQEIAVQSFIAGLPASCSIVQLSVALVERLALDEQHALGTAIPQSLLELADHLDGESPGSAAASLQTLV